MAEENFDNYSPETLQELGKLMLKMSRNKDTRRSLIQGVKKVDPNYMLPGDQQVEDLRQELADQRAADEEGRRAREVTDRLARQRAGLLDGTLIPGRKFDEAQVKEIEEQVMPKFGVSDYEAAAKIYAHDLKPPKPHNAFSPTATWTLPEIPGLLEDPVKAAKEAAYKVIDELHGAAA